MGIEKFKSYELTTDQIHRVEVTQQGFGMLLDLVDSYIPEGREKSLVITKLEEACMWATKAISREVKEDIIEVEDEEDSE